MKDSVAALRHGMGSPVHWSFPINDSKEQHAIIAADDFEATVDYCQQVASLAASWPPNRQKQPHASQQVLGHRSTDIVGNRENEAQQEGPDSSAASLQCQLLTWKARALLGVENIRAMQLVHQQQFSQLASKQREVNLLRGCISEVFNRIVCRLTYGMGPLGRRLLQ